MLSEIRFLRHLIAADIASSMEYRVNFIIQIAGMILNNGVYFAFWLIFFERFNSVGGYEIADIYLLFAVANMGFGLTFLFSSNTGYRLAVIIAQGKLDYYLSYPRNVLLHVIFSRMRTSAIGDIVFGLVMYLLTGRFSIHEISLYFITSFLAFLILLGFTVILGSLSFYVGNAEQTSRQMIDIIRTLSLYPHTLFSGFARFIIYSVIPAAFIASIPVEIITTRSPMLLIILFSFSIIIWLTAVSVFYTGLRRYESGNAINVNI